MQMLEHKVFLDNFVHYTFMYFPVFYTFKELLQGDGLDMGIFGRAIEKYKGNFIKDGNSY